MEHIALLFYVPYMVIKVHAAIDYIAAKAGHQSILAVAQQWCHLVGCTREEHGDTWVANLDELVVLAAELAHGLVFKDTTDKVAKLPISGAECLGEGIHLRSEDDTASIILVHDLNEG